MNDHDDAKSKTFHKIIADTLTIIKNFTIPPHPQHPKKGSHPTVSHLYKLANNYSFFTFQVCFLLNTSLEVLFKETFISILELPKIHCPFVPSERGKVTKFFTTVSVSTVLYHTSSIVVGVFHFRILHLIVVSTFIAYQ